jgi:hypothetical protein
MARSNRRLLTALRRSARSLPGAYEEFPWGEPVAEVRGKVFAFMGSDEDGVWLSLKLPASSGGAAAGGNPSRVNWPTAASSLGEGEPWAFPLAPPRQFA